MDRYKHINYNGQDYTVFNVKYKGYDLPVLLNKKDFLDIKKMGKEWRCNQNGFISCSHTYNGITKDVYIHELVMLLKNKNNNEENLKKPIVHINKLGLDNRRDNLMYDTQDKETNKNLVKKERTVKLPKDSGINPNEIPTYIWYMKPDASHGDRFIVKISDISWKTSSSPDLSLRYKLEEGKMFLRNLLKKNPGLIEEYSMNGDYNKEGKLLLKSYRTIINVLGYKNIKMNIQHDKTFEYLRPNYTNLTDQEMSHLRAMKELVRN
jgi:hypothetical protein